MWVSYVSDTWHVLTRNIVEGEIVLTNSIRHETLTLQCMTEPQVFAGFPSSIETVAIPKKDWTILGPILGRTVIQYTIRRRLLQ